jgi:hypothetical protein
VARAHGISRTWASKEANAPGTRLLIASLLDEHRKEVRELVRLSLQAIKAAFKADRWYWAQDEDGGELVYAGEDHYARLAAVKRTIELSMAGRHVPGSDDAGGKQTITWELFLALYENARKAEA